MAAADRLKRLFAPSSIAFVGGSIAEMAIHRSEDIGYTGEIWPVHPSRDELAGYTSFPSLDALPGVPDAAFIGVRRELTVDAVRTLSAAGAGGCVCYAAGFAEIGGDGEALQERLVDAAGDMPLIGPNCFGMVNYVDRAALWPYLFGGEPPEHGVALVSQSGNMAMNLTMNQRSVNLTHVIAAGNQAVLGPADYVEALLYDHRVRAIGMYVEGFDDVDRFARAAARAMQKGVPIVALKVGRTEESARRSSSHTSSLTGSDILYDAFFDRLGIVRVDSLNRLLETLKIFDLGAGPLGRNVLTLSCSGGEAAMIADLVPRVGLETPPFSDAQTQELYAQFPAYVTVSNPFDYNTSIWGDQAGMERCFTAAMGGDHDAAFLVHDQPASDSPEVAEWIAALDAFGNAHRKTGTPAFVVCTISELLPKDIRRRALDAGVVPLQGLEDGMYAYGAGARYHEFRSTRMQDMTLPRPSGGTQLPNDVIARDEWQSKQDLSAFDVPVPEGDVGTAADAPAIAARIGFPVAIKAVGPEFLHKSDIGAVALNLEDEVGVADAVKRMSASVAEHGLSADRFLVERMAGPVVAEVIVGINRDEQFGPALVIGSGGILVELVADSVSLLLPVGREDVRTAIDSLAVAKLLRGYRGNPQGDTEALIEAVLAITAYADANWDSLSELDVNPLLVLPRGRGVVAADALVIVAEQG